MKFLIRPMSAVKHDCTIDCWRFGKCQRQKGMW